jgi:yecA family protein
MASSSPFTAAQAARLDAFLAAPERPPGTLSYHELAGLLFAVASSPDVVQPWEWLALVFDEQPGFATVEEVREILPVVMALYNHLTAGVLEGTTALPPGCVVHDEPLANLDSEAALCQWARGFADGHDWLVETWEAYLSEELDDEMSASFTVLSFFASLELAQAYRDEMNAHDVSLEELAGEMLAALPQAMQGYAGIGRELFEQTLAAMEAGMYESVSADGTVRGEPCPCGSGRDYAMCCRLALH